MLRVIQHLSRYRSLSSATVVGGYSKEDYQNVSYYFIEADDEKAGIDSLGEDAFFLSKTKKKFDFYGVADGVGGWRRQGVDPSIFSSTLMRYEKPLPTSPTPKPIKRVPTGDELLRG